MITATVCGSFGRHLTAIYEAVQSMHDRRVRVLSPEDPRVVDAIGGFVFVASDRSRSMKLVEDRHLASIGASDFVWLVAPDGYVGPSAAIELGYALASCVPIYCTNPLRDATLDLYVRKVADLQTCLANVERFQRGVGVAKAGQLLIDPDHYGEQYLQKMGDQLNRIDELRKVMLRPHSASMVEPVYHAAKREMSTLLLPHD